MLIIIIGRSNIGKELNYTYKYSKKLVTNDQVSWDFIIIVLSLTQHP